MVQGNIMKGRAVELEMAGMGSSRTGLDLEDSSRTKFCGLGLGLEDSWPWPRRPLALALASTMHGLGFEICW